MKPIPALLLTTLLTLLLCGCSATAAKVPGIQVCGIQPMGQNESGVLIVRMYCKDEGSN